MAVLNQIGKIRRRNHALVAFDQDRIVRVILRAASSVGGFEQDYLPGAAVEHGGRGDGQHGPAFRVDGDFDRGVHGRLQQPVGVGQFDADLRGAGFRLEGGINESDFAGESPARIRGQADGGGLTGLHQRQILLEHVGDDPDRGEVGDVIERLAGHETHALGDVLFEDDAGGR